MKNIKFLVIGLVFFTGLVTFLMHLPVRNEINSTENVAVKPVELAAKQDTSNAVEQPRQKKIIDVSKFKEVESKEKRLDAAEDAGEEPFMPAQEIDTKAPVSQNSPMVNVIAPQDNIIGSASQPIRNKTGPGSKLAPLANNTAPDFETAPITNNTGPGPEFTPLTNNSGPGPQFVPIASRNGPGPEFTPLTNNSGPGPQFTPVTNTTGPVPESTPANNAGS